VYPETAPQRRSLRKRTKKGIACSRCSDRRNSERGTRSGGRRCSLFFLYALPPGAQSAGSRNQERGQKPLVGQAERQAEPLAESRRARVLYQRTAATRIYKLYRRNPP